MMCAVLWQVPCFAKRPVLCSRTLIALRAISGSLVGALIQGSAAAQAQLAERLTALSRSVLSSLAALRRGCVAAQDLQRQLLEDCSSASPQRLGGSLTGGRAGPRLIQHERQLPGSSSSLLLRESSGDVPPSKANAPSSCGRTASSGRGVEEEQLLDGFQNATAGSPADFSLPESPGQGWQNSGVGGTRTPLRAGGARRSERGWVPRSRPASGEAPAREDLVCALATAAAAQLQAIDGLMDQVPHTSHQMTRLDPRHMFLIY